jgi:hypothetical protein
METTETTSDAVYKWTIRTLYTAAIALNVWYLLEQYRQTPEGKTLLSRAERIKDKIARNLHAGRRFRRLADETLVEAWIVVDQANKEKEDDSADN